MQPLVLFEFYKERIKRSQIFRRRLAVKVEDGGKGEAEQQVVCCSSGEPLRLEVRKFDEVRFIKQQSIKPVHSPFVTVV